MSEAHQSTRSFYDARPDADTLGGRISRAREALNLTASQLARRLGVKSETVNAWESDRSEPRGNRLTMLAGVMGVSPTWLLNGVGDAPADNQLHSELHLLQMQLTRLKEHQAEGALIVSALERELERFSSSLDR